MEDAGEDLPEGGGRHPVSLGGSDTPVRRRQLQLQLRHRSLLAATG